MLVRARGVIFAFVSPREMSGLDIFNFDCNCEYDRIPYSLMKEKKYKVFYFFFTRMSLFSINFQGRKNSISVFFFVFIFCLFFQSTLKIEKKTIFVSFLLLYRVKSFIYLEYMFSHKVHLHFCIFHSPRKACSAYSIYQSG